MGSTQVVAAEEELRSARLAESVVVLYSAAEAEVAAVLRHSEVEVEVALRHQEAEAAVSLHQEAVAAAVYFQAVAAAECCRRLAYRSFVFPRNLRPVMPEPVD